MFAFPHVPCMSTADMTTGSTCSLTTTINTLFGASAIVSGQRAIWQLNDVKFFDGGANGAGTAGETLFAVGGVFFP